MANAEYSNFLMDGRAYVATRIVLTSAAWLLLLTGSVTSAEDLTGSLMVSGALVATSVTVGVVLALRMQHIPFERILVWAAPADLVTLGLLVAALHRYGDPVLAVVIVFTVFYGHVLERRASQYLTVAAALVYLGSHAGAHPTLDWYEGLFLGMKALAVGYVGFLSAAVSERRRAHERHADEAIIERDVLTSELRQRVEELQAISDVNDMIHSTLEFERVGAGIVRILCDILGVSVGCVLVMDKRENTMLFKASVGVESETPLNSDLLASEAIGAPSLEGRAQIAVAGQHLVCMSVLDHKSMIVLFCADPEALERFTGREMTVLQAVSSAIAVAVENSQLYLLTRRLAITDELTGLSNYRHLQQRLDEEVERARRYQKAFSLLMLDADDFKRFNDTQGHIAGDDALAAIASIMKSVVREVDLVARYGGEEFSIILPETDSPGAFIVAEKIREAIASHEFADAGGAPGPRLTVSVGLASFPVHAHDKESLLKQADDALYQAKSGGKNRVRAARMIDVPEPGTDDSTTAKTGDSE